MRKVLLLVILATCGFGLTAQPVGKSAYGALIEAAEMSVANKDYYNALVKYEEAYDDRGDKALLPLIAEMKFQLRDYFGAARDYSSALRGDRKGELEDLRFNYARALKMTGKYEDAQEQFQLFMATNPSDSLRILTENELTGIEMALAYEDDDKEEFKPERLGREVNGKFSEYSATYGRDGSLYFSTFDAEDVIILGGKGDGEDGEDGDEEGGGGKFAKIYRSTMGDRDWEEPQELDVKINRPGFHSGNVSFSADGNRMYFTRVQLEGNVPIQSKIYYSTGGDENWGAANECVGVNGDWIAKHPAVGELLGREVLFFVANIDGGYGGDDIYYATYKGEGVYAEPVNLGPTINSPGNEITPFYIDGTLYFSSDGHPGFGGHDIFFSVWDGAKWSAPENLGGRYNSAQDDQYFSLDREGFKGFFTSNRVGTGMRSVEARTCCDDIYGFELEQINANLVVGLFDEATRQPLLGGVVILKNEVMNTRNSQTQPEVNRFDFPLELEMSYQIVATREGYFPDTAAVATVDLSESQEFVQRFFLKQVPPPPPPPEEPEYDTITIEQAIVLENILYEFDDDKILPSAESDLEVVERLLEDYPDMVIELSSHTDYRGNAAYNENLSQRRAESARNWLLERGIAPERIVAKGYGKEQPQTITEKIAEQFDFLPVGAVLTRGFIDDSLETEEQKEVAHQINRRTEFKILEGPTSIIIKRTELVKKEDPDAKKKEEAKKKKAAPKAPVISELSSLYGRKDLSQVPILDFVTRTTDFGTVKKGDKKKFDFIFANKGKVEARIDTYSACDCTTVTFPRKVIPPGEVGVVHVVFDSADKEEAEKIVIDIFLENEDPEGNPIIEKVEYTFDIQK